MTSDPPPPARPQSDVAGRDVWRGFLVGLALSWAVRLPLLGITSLLGDGPARLVVGVASFVVPPVALLVAILRASRHGRKSRAIGMAIYAAVGALILGPLFATFGMVWVICGAGSGV